MSTVEQLRQLGNEAFKEKNYMKAIDLYTEAIDIDPTNYTLFSNRSGSYCAVQKYAQAAADARKAIEIKPDWFRGHARLGAALLGSGDFRGAITAYEKALELDPGNVAIQEDIADAKSRLKEQNKTNPILQLFKPENFEALRNNATTAEFFKDQSFLDMIEDMKRDPQNIAKYISDKRLEACIEVLLGPLMQQIQSQKAAKQNEKAKDIKQKAQKLSSNQGDDLKEEEKTHIPKPINEAAEAERLAGNECFKAGDIEGAIQHYNAGIDIDPYNVTLHSNLATCLIRQKKYEEAIDVATKAIENGRDHGADFTAIAKAYTKIASAEAARNNLEGAIAALNASLLEKKDPLVKRELTRIQQLKAKRDAAAYEDKEIAELEKNAGNMSFREGDVPTAIEHYNEAIKRAPRNPMLYSNRAAAYSRLGEMPMALKDCDKALELDPRFIKAYTRKGYCHFQMKEYHRALDAYNAALKIDPNCAEAIGGIESVNAAINRNTFSAPDQEQIRRAMADPEIQRILADPGLQQVLRDLQENPNRAAAYMADPSIHDALMKLRAAGILR